MGSLVRLIVAAIAFGLSACFVSDKPFLDAANADFPFGDTTHWNIKDERDRSRFEYDLVLKDGHYEAKDDSDHVQHLFKAIGGDFYVWQLAADREPALYQLVRADGGTLYMHDSECLARAAETFQAAGAIERWS